MEKPIRIGLIFYCVFTLALFSLNFIFYLLFDELLPGEVFVLIFTSMSLFLCLCIYFSMQEAMKTIRWLVEKVEIIEKAQFTNDE